MKKRIDMTLKYNFTFYPEDVGLNNDCTEREFYKAVDDWLSDLNIDIIENPPDEIETEYYPEEK